MASNLARPARVLVVDDEREIVRSVTAYLEQAGFRTVAAYDGESALHALRRERPDLMVLDLMLPDRDGWEITRLVRADHELASLPIILLTARAEDTDKVVGLELGADDYITKPFNPREVVARVRALLRRATQRPDAEAREVLEWGELLLDAGRHELLIGGQPVAVTPTEFRLLQVLMESPGYAFTRSQFIERALGHDYAGFERTLDSHIRNLRRKIEPPGGGPVYIETVYGVGYRLAGRPPLAVGVA